MKTFLVLDILKNKKNKTFIPQNKYNNIPKVYHLGQMSSREDVISGRCHLGKISFKDVRDVNFERYYLLIKNLTELN